MLKTKNSGRRASTRSRMSGRNGVLPRDEDRRVHPEKFSRRGKRIDQPRDEDFICATNDHRKLGRKPAHRKALLRNLMNALVHAERIETTVSKAKELRPLADRLITSGRQRPSIPGAGPFPS